MKPSSPCVSLLLSILAPIVAFTTASAADPATTYIADGVSIKDIVNSTRFYDTGKGLYWKQTGQPYNGAQQLYDQYGGFSFLGDLQPRISGTEFRPAAFDNLVHDGTACWYCVAANVIQYWESYYGVFYKEDAPLPYGYTYDKAHLSTLAGTQSLDIHMSFYDSWILKDNTVGGDGEMAIEWYLATGKNINAGKPNYAELNPAALCKGAFYSNYFQGSAAARENYFMGGDSSDLRSATDFLKEAFGYNRDGERTTYGQIAYIGLLTPTTGTGGLTGHALTCYGFTLGEDGLLESLYLTNSDDASYCVFQAFIGVNEQGFLHLYQDAAHTRDWKYANLSWNIADITYINTPTLLKEMYDEYTNAALVWSGARSTWSDKDAAEATTENLPDAQAGWKVFAMDDLYNSYYHEGREVAFTDSAGNSNVTLEGALNAPAVRIDNNTKDYTFTGTAGTTLETDTISKLGSGSATFSTVAITAGTVNVDMGTLNLGTGATLTAESGAVDNMGTLALSGGSATFTSGLNICSSGTLAVNASSTLTSTLTLQEGSYLYFNLGSGNTSTPLLTLNGNLNVWGDSYLTVNDSALTAGQKYILMSVTGSILGWNDISTNSGNITLNGKQLVLEFITPEKLTWSQQEEGYWSVNQWDGTSIEHTDKDLIFSRAGDTTVTVQGTVSPNSMLFNQGNFTLKAGTDAVINGCRTITLSNGANLTSAVPLTGADISIGSDSTLTMQGLSAASSEVSGLEMAAGSKLVLCGSTDYLVKKAGALNGTVELKDTASLQLSSAIDTEFYGNLVGNANTEVILMNSAGDRGVVFYVGKDPADFKGTITIGTNDDGAPLTTLRIGSAIRNFTINKSGELSLRGRGDISGKIEGTGTLTIEHDATFQLAKDGQPAFAKEVELNVKGTAEIGSDDAPLPKTAMGDITVSGQLTVHYKSPGAGEALKVDSLTLQNGGSYTLVHSFPERGSDLTSRHVINELTVTDGGTLSNTVASVEDLFTLSYPRTIEIGKLSGSGSLTLEAENQSYVTQTIINDTATEGYGGDLFIRNPHCDGYSYKDGATGTIHFVNTGLTVEMSSGTINGSIVLDAQGFAAEPQDASKQSGLIHGGLAAFGIRGDVSVLGIDDSSSSKTTYLYSGIFQGGTVYVDTDTLFSFLDRIEPEHHTLTLNGAEEYDFHGKVYAYLNLSKQGSGKQTFSGDVSAFEGELTVSGGELEFTHAIYKATAVTLNGGTLKLHGGNLKNVGGSGGELILEAAESGATYDIGFTNDESRYTMQLNGVTATLSGLAPAITADQDSTIQAAAGTALTLQAPITNNASLTLKGAFDATKLTLDTKNTHIDTEGNTGESGFAYTGVSSVTIVKGGTTIGTDAIITHNELQGKQFTLGKNGTASAGGEKDLTSYLLTGTDTASVAAINAQAGSKLTSIDMQGGTLNVDAATNKLQAVGGQVNITRYVTLGGTAKDTAISSTTTATLNASLSGNSSITKTGDGTLTVTADNTHSGTTTVTGGVLNVANKNALGTGEVSLSGGTLQISANDFANTVTSSGTSTINVVDTYTLTLREALTNSGSLTLSGNIDASALTLTEDASTHVDVNGKTGASGFTKSGVASVTIVKGGTTNGTGATIKHSKLQSGTLTLGTDGKATSGGTIDYSSYLLTGTDTVSVSAINKKAGAQLKSIDVESGTITVDVFTEKLHTTGGKVVITNGVTVGGSIADTRIVTSGGTIKAAITGSSTLDLNENAKVVIDRANDYTGETALMTNSVLRVSNKDALGSSEVYLTCGTLEIACNELANTVTSTCHDSVLSVLDGYVLKLTESNKISNISSSASITLKGSFDASGLELSKNDTRIDTGGNAGASGFALKGSRSVTIVNGGTCKDGGVSIRHNQLQSGTLVLGKNGVASTSGTMDYSSYLLTGSDKATISTIYNQAGSNLQSVIMEGGTLTVDTGTDKVTATGGTLNITAGGAVHLNRDNALTDTQVTMNGGSLALNGHKQGIDIKVSKASTLTTGGNAQVNSLQVSSQGVEDSNGKLMFADELTLSGTLTTGSFTLTKGDIKNGAIAVTGAAEVTQGYIGAGISGTTLVKSGAGKRVELGGKNTFTGGVSVNEGSLALLEGSKMQANITVMNKAALLTAVNVDGSISLESGAIMRLRPNATYSLNRGLAAAGAQFYGNLTTGEGATLTLNGTNAAALTVYGNATLSGGSITYAGTACLNVTGALTLQNATKANVTWSSGSHKLATAGSIQTNGNNLYEFFDLAQEAYTLAATDKDITLTVNETKSPALMRIAGIKAPAGLAQAQPGMPDEMQAEEGRTAQAQAPVSNTLMRDVADTLVQADWGTVHAARAFNGTLNGRHQSLRAICNGRTAVWADAIGSTTRQSSARGHAGADHNLYGGVFGVEFNAGTRGAAGLAIGHTWDRVNTFGMSRVKQDSQHAGAFGRAKLSASGAHSLWLEASASYGKTDSRGTLGASRERWSQDSCTLNVHANDVWQLDEETAVNIFGGLEYVATDSGHIDDLHTGSVQNLRGEIGAGVTRTIGRGMVFAEATLLGDMVRHNPQADLGTRRGGANPGRIGGSISVGGAYILNAHWSVNATYTFEGVKHSNSHNASVGATFRF